MAKTLERQGRMEVKGENLYFWIDLNERNYVIIEIVKKLKVELQIYKEDNERLIKM